MGSTKLEIMLNRFNGNGPLNNDRNSNLPLTRVTLPQVELKPPKFTPQEIIFEAPKKSATVPSPTTPLHPPKTPSLPSNVSPSPPSPSITVARAPQLPREIAKIGQPRKYGDTTFFISPEEIKKLFPKLTTEGIKNALAFLATLRQAESEAGPNAYRKLFGGRYIERSQFASKYPNIEVKASRYTSTAFGAYQIIRKTSNAYGSRVAKLVGHTNGPLPFTERNQDVFGLYLLITVRNSVEALNTNNFSKLLSKNSYEWAGLPTSVKGDKGRHGQAHMSGAALHKYYVTQRAKISATLDGRG